MHTPGPWVFLPNEWNENGDHEGSVGSIHSDDSNGEGLYICALDDLAEEHDGTSEQLANARLIAAAPDLLEALREVVSFLESDIGGTLDIAKAQAAIAKAENVEVTA